MNNENQGNPRFIGKHSWAFYEWAFVECQCPSAWLFSQDNLNLGRQITPRYAIMLIDAEALEQARRRTEKLAAQLRALGVEPDM